MRNHFDKKHCTIKQKKTSRIEVFFVVPPGIEPGCSYGSNMRKPMMVIGLDLASQSGPNFPVD